MKYAATLIAVRDLKGSLAFYCDVLGLEVIRDFGTNVTLSGGIALRTLES